MSQIETVQLPKVVGPYSHAIIAGDFIFCSGQIALDPITGILVTGTVSVEMKQVLKNMEAVLAAYDCTFADVVKTELYLTHIDDFAVVNEIYAQAFREPFPTRATIVVAALPKEAKVELSAVAYRKKHER